MRVADGLVLAAFVSPLLFYIGAGAVSVPILIHVLARRRFKRIRWAATAFLLRAERRNRRRVRVEQLILLALRCLAVLLLALLVARPFLEPGGLASLVGTGEGRERILILDDSFSMAAQARGATTFDLAVRWTTRLLDTLQRESPNDRITILLSSEPDTPLASGQFLDDLHVQEMKETLERAEVSQQAFQMEPALVAVRDRLGTLDKGFGAAVYLISDFRQADWLGKDGAALVRTVQKLQQGRADGGSVELTMVDVGLKDQANLAVADIQAVRARAVEGVGTRFDVSVANLSGRALENVELRLFVDDAMQPGRTIPKIEAGETIRVPAEAVFLQQGWGALRVEVTGRDVLPIDDSRYLGMEVVRAVRLAVVNGEPEADAYGDEVALLRAALQPEGEVFSGNQVTVMEPAQFEDHPLDEYDLVILANVYRMTAPAVAKLEKFVTGGGGAIFFMGDQVDVGGYNDLLYRDGAGLLPARLGQAVVLENAEGGVSAATEDMTHPLVRSFGGARHLLSAPKFRGYVPIMADAGESSALEAEAATSRRVDGGGLAQVVLRLSDADGTPLIVDRSFGRGCALLVTSSCDREWNNWAEAVSFPVMMLEMASYASRSGSDGQAGVLVGSPIEMEIAPDRFEPMATVRGPDYPSSGESGVRAESSPGIGGLVIRWGQTGRSGIYRFHLRQRDGQGQDRLAAVNLDARECDLTKMTKAQMEEVLRGVPFRFMDDSTKEAATASAGRSELWPIVLAMVMTTLMLEQYLAWRFGRRA